MIIIDQIKKGIKAIAMAFEKETIDEKRIVQLINRHRTSKELMWAEIGKRYYKVEPDILFRKKEKKDYQANNRLVHAKYTNMVDEKISYLLSNRPTIKAETDEGTELIIEMLGRRIGYHLETLGYEASNTGIGWLHPYIGPDGKLHYKAMKTEQIIPGWADDTETKLDWVIRYYTSTVYRLGKEVSITKVELWTPTSVDYYRLEGNQLIREQDTSGHFLIDGEPAVWNRVPFIAFKNNRDMIPDIKLVKSLLDNYDEGRSEDANYIDELANLIFVLKGYSGSSLDKFLQTLFQNRAIVLDADEEAGVDTLSPNTNIDASKSHIEQLNRDILESGQAVNRDLDRFGNAPSGIALKFLFSNLDLKASKLESEFKRGFEVLIEFIYDYLELINGMVERENVTILFNRDKSIDEAAAIENCKNSIGIVSTDTILANHPWVTNVQEEKERLEEERKKELEEQGLIFNTVDEANINNETLEDLHKELEGLK